MNKLIISIILLATIAISVTADPPEWWTSDMSKALETPWSSAPIKPFSPLAESFHCKNYVINIYRDDVRLPPASFEILRDGEFVYGGYEHQIWIPDDQQIKPGTDITGDGSPNLIVASRKDGAHPGNDYTLFELEPEFRKIQTIESVGVFTNLDDDAAIEMVVRDTSFEYFRACYAESTIPAVCLKFRDGAYRFAPELMREPPLPADVLERMADSLSTLSRWDTSVSINLPPPQVLHIFFRFVYSGNYDQAVELFDRSWPDHIGGKAEVRKEVLDRCTEGRFWKEIKKMNRLD